MMPRDLEWMDSQPSGGEAEARSDLLVGLWNHKAIVLVVVCIALGLGYLYYLKAKRVYRSSSQILLIKKERGIVGDTPERASQYLAYEDTLSTQILLVQSPLIITKAVETFKLDELPSLRGGSGAASQIIGGLKALRAGGRDTPDPNVMDVTYAGPDPEDCATVLKAVVASYQDFLGLTYENINRETAQLITQAKDDIHQQLVKQEAAYRAFRQETPLLWKGAEGANMHELRLADVERARAQVLVDNAQIRARLDAIETAMKHAGNREALALLAGRTDSAKTSSGRPSLEDHLFEDLLEEQSLSEQFGPDHPKLQMIRHRMELIRTQLKGVAPDTADPHDDFLAVFVESLRQELKIGEQKLLEFDSLFERERREAKMQAVEQLTDEQYRNEIGRLQKMFEQLVKRMQEINLAKDSAAMTAQVIAPPAPGAPVEPVLTQIMTKAGVLGLLSGVGLALLAGILDRGFRSAGQIRRQLGLPVIGQIPTLDLAKLARIARQGAYRQCDASLCTLHEPKGRQAEAFRAVRTSLYFNTHDDHLKILLVTSPTPGDGKTTIAANLAVAIADSGKKTLLVDGDFRRPRIHHILGVANAVGLSDVIKGPIEPCRAVQPTPVANLWTLPCGSAVENPADLLTSPRLKQIFDLLRQQYDFIVVDSPPLLAVTDSSVIAARVDAAILTLRISNRSRSEAGQAVEMLASLGVKTLGIVANQLKPAGEFGYGYGHYYESREDAEGDRP